MSAEPIDTLRDPIKITESRLLVAEGKDEELFFEALIKNIGLQGVQVLGRGGKTQISAFLPGLRDVPGFDNVERLGIIRDADNDAKAAFQSVRDALKAAGLPVPKDCLQTAGGGSDPRVTILILPGNSASGMLEDVCLKAVEDDPAMVCVEQYFDCLQEKDVTPPKPLSKARIHAFLSSRPKPDLRLGEAAQRDLLPWDSPAFHQIKGFLKQVTA